MINAQALFWSICAIVLVVFLSIFFLVSCIIIIFKMHFQNPTWIKELYISIHEFATSIPREAKETAKSILTWKEEDPLEIRRTTEERKFIARSRIF